MDLDLAYQNSIFIKDGDLFVERWKKAAANFRADEGGLMQFITSDMGLGIDLFQPVGVAKGCFTFIHGGYWMKFSPRDFSHLAKGALARGWAVAMPFYDLAPKASLGRMALQIESALRALTALDLGPMVVSGHSAGGHLAARMACTDIHVPMQRVVPISPLSDLEQIAQTDMNKTLGLNPLQVATQSPAHLAKHPNIDAHVWVGGIERPAFLWQARLLSEAWDCDWTVVRGRHHFDVIEDLTDPQSDFMNICLGGL